MLNFGSDYIAGAHPKILQKLMETNLEVMSGYGSDVYCKSAADKIKAACQCETADVWFITGGTQTNALVISTMLRDYEGVIAAKTGHVSSHEAGAIEYTSHKVIELEQEAGKLKAETVDKYVAIFYADGNHEHMVFPGMVYISHPTEYGTLYSKEELTKLSEVCRKYKMPLYIDGARLGYGLMSRQTDLTLADIAELADVFYIGGTKVGALCGEALVFTKQNTPPHFLNAIKRRGALLAKGRLLGVQFDAMFTDNLYLEIGKHGIDMAEKLKKMFLDKGYKLLLDSPTNQQFIILDNETMEKLSREVVFSFWETYDASHTVVRFATSWSTTEEELVALEKLL